MNTISAGPLKSRAASAIGKGGDKSFIEVAIDYCRENAPLKKDLYADDARRELTLQDARISTESSTHCHTLRLTCPLELARIGAASC